MEISYNYIILSNSFSMDTRLERLTRLKKLSDHIEKYASEVSLSQDNLNWSLNAWKEFEKLLLYKYQDLDEKNNISQISQNADAALYERYVIIKDLFLTELSLGTADNIAIIKRLGLDGPIPFKKDERIKKAFQLIDAYEEMVKSGAKTELPYLMIENLKHLALDAKQKLDLITNERLDAMQLTNDLNQHFEADNLKLRQIYKWVVAFWGKKDPRLFDLGFTPLKTYFPGNSVEKITNFIYNRKEAQFTWDIDAKSDSYQLAKRLEKSGREWIEIYNGSNNFYNYNTAEEVRQFRVRAYNEYGYGEWSEVLLAK